MKKIMTAPQTGVIINNFNNIMDTDTFDFSTALTRMKAGEACARKAWNNPSIKVMVQKPDDRSKMTIPYLYMEKIGKYTDPTVRFPLDLSAESIFAEDWFIVS